MTVEVYPDDDEHLAARFAAGSPVTAIVSDDPVERASRLAAAIAMAASTEIRVHRVGNGLRSPLTLARIAFQLANRGAADDAVDPAPSSRPHAKSVLIIEQAETLALDALSAMQGMAGVQLLLVGSSALRAMLAALEREPSKSGASAQQDEHEHEWIDDPAWAIDWDDDPFEEHPAAHPAFESDEPPPVLRAVPRPHSDRPRAVRGLLWIAAAATVAIAIAATTLGKPANLSPPPTGRPQSATFSPAVAPPAVEQAAVAPPAMEQAAVAPSPRANQPARSADQREFRQATAASPRSSVPTVSAPDLNAVVSSAAPGSALAPAHGAPANAEAPPPADPAAKLRRQFETFLQSPENRGRHFAAYEKEALFAQFSGWSAQRAAGSAPPGPALGHAARIVLHVPRTARVDGPGGANRLIDVLGPLGTVQTRIVDEQPTEPSVRYFYREDAAVARQVATALDGADPGWQPRDFTSYRPKPVAGTIEVWLPRR